LYWIRSSTIGTLVKKYLGKLKSKKKEKEIKKAECKKNETTKIKVRPELVGGGGGECSKCVAGS